MMRMLYGLPFYLAVFMLMIIILFDGAVADCPEIISLRKKSSRRMSEVQEYALIYVRFGVSVLMAVM